MVRESSINAAAPVVDAIRISLDNASTQAVVQTPAPGFTLRIVATALQSLEPVPVALRVTGHADDLAALRLGYSSPTTESLRRIQGSGPAALGFGSLPGVVMAAGNVLTDYSDGRREGPVTISASVDPVVLPVPVAFPLRRGALAWRGSGRGEPAVAPGSQGAGHAALAIQWPSGGSWGRDGAARED